MNSITGTARPLDIDQIVKIVGGEGDRTELIALLRQIADPKLLLALDSAVNAVIADVLETSFLAGVEYARKHNG